MSERGRIARACAARVTLVALGVAATLGCAAATPPARSAPSARELVMAYDDARASGTMAFPSDSYESLVQFQLPSGEHRPLRLRFQAEAEGQVEITIYGSTLLETPGPPLRTFTCALGRDDLSDGKDGRWVVQDLVDMKPIKGVVWVGVHKTGGAPTLWASSVVSGHVFVRNNDPQNPMDMLPTKRTPLLRLELGP